LRGLVDGALGIEFARFPRPAEDMTIRWAANLPGAARSASRLIIALTEAESIGKHHRRRPVTRYVRTVAALNYLVHMCPTAVSG
jgi:hypothetical protein